MNVIMDTPQSTEILTLLRGIDAKLGGGLAEFRVEVAARFKAVDARFDAMDRRLDRKVDGLRNELVDHMERIHQELDLRLQDVEKPRPKARAK